MDMPEGLRYTKEHEWVRIEGRTATVGVTDYAQESLGDVTFVDPPKAGAVLEAGKVCATVESVKAVSDIYAPVGGRVIAANPELASRPELVNRSPYGEGYLFTMEVVDPSDVEGLMDAVAYRRHVEALSA